MIWAVFEISRATMCHCPFGKYLLRKITRYLKFNPGGLHNPFIKPAISYGRLALGRVGPLNSQGILSSMPKKVQISVEKTHTYPSTLSNVRSLFGNPGCFNRNACNHPVFVEICLKNNHLSVPSWISIYKIKSFTSWISEISPFE